MNALKVADTEKACLDAAKVFQSIDGFKDSELLYDKCLEKAEVCRKDAVKIFKETFQL